MRLLAGVLTAGLLIGGCDSPSVHSPPDIMRPQFNEVFGTDLQFGDEISFIPVRTEDWISDSTNIHSSMVSAAAVWDAALAPFGVDVTVDNSSADRLAPVTFETGTGGYCGGQGVIKRASSGCFGGHALVVFDLTNLLVHEFGHSIGFSDLDSVYFPKAADYNCAMTVPTAGELSGSLCAYEEQILAYHYGSRNAAPDLGEYMVSGITSSPPSSMDRNDTIFVPFGYQEYTDQFSATATVAPSVSIGTPSLLTVVSVGTGGAYLASNSTWGSTSVTFTLDCSSDPRVIWSPSGCPGEQVMVSVSVPTPASVELSADTIRLGGPFGVTDSVLIATVKDSGGNPISGVTVSWSQTNPDAVAMSPSGNMAFVSNRDDGVSYVTVSVPGTMLSASAKVRVVCPCS